MEIDNKKFKLARLQNMEGTQLTGTTYNLVIGLVLLWGFAVNILMALALTRYIVSMNYIVTLILYFALSLGGMFIVFKSNQPAVSFLGFTLLSIGMGLVLTYFLTMYDGRSIYTAFVMTGIITLVMIAASMIFPSFFLSIGRALGIALIAAIVVEVVGGLLLHLNLSIMDYVVVLIFAGYIGYDWAKAQQYPKVLDNAIDSAADIYVDIINIFIRILSIIGKKD